MRRLILDKSAEANKRIQTALGMMDLVLTIISRLETELVLNLPVTARDLANIRDRTLSAQSRLTEIGHLISMTHAEMFEHIARHELNHATREATEWLDHYMPLWKHHITDGETALDMFIHNADFIRDRINAMRSPEATRITFREKLAADKQKAITLQALTRTARSLDVQDIATQKGVKAHE